MPFNFRERPNSRRTSANPPTIVMEYVATGEHDPATVKAYAMAVTAPVVVVFEGFLYRQDMIVAPGGYDTYYVTVPYGMTNEVVGEYSLSFDTTGGTIHISHSKATVASYGTSPPSHKQLIGVNGDNVDGVNIVIPALKISVNYRHPMGFVSIAQIKAFASNTGKVNSASFLTFAAGEVLFLGATGQEGTAAPTDVSYHFAMSANATGLSIGDIASIAKAGHDYLWIAYKDNVDGGKPVKQPEFVYVERVYDTVNLAAALGFGG